MNTSSNGNHQNHTIRYLRLWLVAIGLVLFLWFGSWAFLISCYSGLTDWSQRGSFGDMFGAVNALFSGLAFAALVITVYLQSNALIQTRAEVEERSFENKFFQLIHGYNDILNGIGKYQKVDGGIVRIVGRQRFEKLYQEYQGEFNTQLQKAQQEDPFKLVQRTYKTFFERNEAELGNYFLNLYNIVAFIDRSSISNKKDYTRLLRAQLSSYEVLLLFYNCLSEYGHEKFKPLLEKYSLLEHLPNKLLSDILRTPTNHRSMYDPSALKGS